MATAELIMSTPNPLEILKMAAGMCYQKEDTPDFVLEHIIDAGHLSVLEHCYATFKVKCSIVVLMQLTRHRHLSFTCQSSRGSELTSYYRTGDDWVDDMNEMTMDDYTKTITGGDYDGNFHPKEILAYMVPKAAEYNLLVTGNFRAWFEYLPKRLCLRASKEHRELAEQIHKQLKEVCPLVFDMVKTNCANCHEKGCSFV